MLLEEQLALAIERERVAILVDFIRDAAHEFRTPLSVIKNSLYLLAKSPDQVRQAEQIEALKAPAIHINELVESMLTMSRLDGTDELLISSLNLVRLLDEVKIRMKMSAQDKAITLTFVVDEHIPPISR